MARRLIVLCDGTFNDPSDNTNVFQFKNALARPDQVVYYDEGVGITEEGNTKGWFGRAIDSVLGGAFGSGLSANVQQGYRWVCENYQDGDDLYFLGFSRGAFTARSIVGMIRKIGLVRAPLDSRTLKAAFDVYRDEHHPNCAKTERFRAKLNTRHVDRVNLRFVGVWDTVGALGVPVVGPRSFLARKRWGFHDLRLSSKVQTARHALAVDEKRSAFLPAPWCHEDDERDVKQVWFAGCHSDIGGQDGALARWWMLEEAEAAGLTFDPDLPALPEPSPPQELHESLSTPYRVGTGSVLRPIHEKNATGAGPRFLNESIDPSADHLREEGKSIPLSARQNLAVAETKPLKGPKPGWGLFLGYYLQQYEALCQVPEPCCDELVTLGP